MFLPDPVLALDKKCLLAINHTNSAWSDNFFWMVSGWGLPIVFGVLILLLLLKDNGVKAFWYLLFLALTIAMADNISSAILKPIVARLRPTHDPSLMNLLHVVRDYRGGMYGFVSSHAANAFGAAIFFSLLLRNRWFTWALFIWAVITSYSRIYLGVHFPTDILGGMVVGLLSGACCFLLMQVLAPFVSKKVDLEAAPFVPLKERAYFLIIYVAAFLFILVKSFC